VGSLRSWSARRRDADLMRRNLDLLVVIGCLLVAVALLLAVSR
jgi:hypothetical protein